MIHLKKNRMSKGKHLFLLALDYSPLVKNDPLVLTYLATKLLHPVAADDTPPYELIAWWKIIFSCLGLKSRDHLELRWMCRIFRDAIPALPLWTSFPNPRYPTLNGLVDRLNHLDNDYVDCKAADMFIGLKVYIYRYDYVDQCLVWVDFTIARINSNGTYNTTKQIDLPSSQRINVPEHNVPLVKLKQKVIHILPSLLFIGDGVHGSNKSNFKSIHLDSCLASLGYVIHWLGKLLNTHGNQESEQLMKTLPLSIQEFIPEFRYLINSTNLEAKKAAYVSLSQIVYLNLVEYHKWTHDHEFCTDENVMLELYKEEGRDLRKKLKAAYTKQQIGKLKLYSFEHQDGSIKIFWSYRVMSYYFSISIGLSPFMMAYMMKEPYMLHADQIRELDALLAEGVKCVSLFEKNVDVLPLSLSSYMYRRQADEPYFSDEPYNSDDPYFSDEWYFSD